MKKMIKDFLHEEDGATAIEYGLIVGLIAIAIIVALTTLGGDISKLFAKISGKLTDATAKADASS